MYDQTARILARHYTRHLPGSPKVLVRNMPGAGTLNLVNYLYNVSPKDGTAFGIFARNIPLIGLLQKTNQNVQFDPLKFTWIGSSASFADDAYLLMRAMLDVNRLDPYSSSDARDWPERLLNSIWWSSRSTPKESHCRSLK